MLLRLLWCALFVAVVVGSVQTFLQGFHAVPLILAAESFEAQQSDGVRHSARDSGHSHQNDAHEHNGALGNHAVQRTLWTWVANAIHAFSSTLLFLAALLLWFWKRGRADDFIKTTALVAGAGFLSLHLWPSLGLPAELPGMDAAALGARQLWWGFSASCAGAGCALMAFGPARWRWPLSILTLALPFIVGAPHLAIGAFNRFSGDALTQMQGLSADFVWASHWLAISFWLMIGIFGGLMFRQWLLPIVITSTTPVFSSFTPSQATKN